MRGSSYLMGALLGRFSNFIVDPPGGCDFGTRPIDQHIKAFETLGADIDTSKGVIEGSAENLSGGNIFFDVIDEIEDHLAVTFHVYISEKHLRIFVIKD